jgi:hypothetical protein
VSAAVHSGVDLADWACSWATKKGALRAEWNARLYYNMCARYRDKSDGRCFMCEV